MPAAMVLPTAADMPNHMPRTFSRPPRDLAEVGARSDTLEPEGGVSAVVLEASIVLDNGVSGSDARRRHNSGGGGKCKLEVWAAKGLQRIGRRSPWRPVRLSSDILAPSRNLSFLRPSDEGAR